MKTKKYSRIFALTYAYPFFADFVLIYPLYGVMIAEAGTQPWQVAFLFAIWSTAVFLLEVPSGVWADRYSRRNILVIGQAFRAAGFALWALVPNFWGFAGGFLLWGVACTFRSGTYEALLYDELAEMGMQHQFTKIYGRSRAVSMAAILSASILASPAVLLGYPAILAMSCGAGLLAGISIALVPKAAKRESTQDDLPNYRAVFSQGIKTAVGKPGVLGLLVFTSLVLVFGGALEEYWAIYADSAGLPAYGLGLFIAAITGVEGLASLLAYRFERRSNTWFYLLFAASGALLFVAGWVFTVPALVLIVLFALPTGILQTVYEGRLQQAIPSEVRATVSSFKGLLVETEALVVYAVIGGLAQISGYRLSLLVMGAAILLAALAYLVFNFFKKLTQG